MRLNPLTKLRHSGNRKRSIGLAVATILSIVGLTATALGIAAQKSISPPAPGAAGTISSTHSIPASEGPATKVLPYAAPVSLSIPAIKVTSSLINVGLNADGSMQIPAPPYYDNAAWYKGSPAPGQYGAAVIIGHVDNYKTGPSVFFNLTKLQPGDTLQVTRSDKKTAVFTVTGVRQYPKSDFPTKLVYTSNNGAELRLITCGGAFDKDSGDYAANTVVFAKLSGVES